MVVIPSAGSGPKGLWAAFCVFREFRWYPLLGQNALMGQKCR